MPHIESFDSLEAMTNRMQQLTTAANQTLAQQQRDVGWGDYWVQFDGESQLIIFGYCMTQAEVEQAERDAGSEPDELVYMMDSMEESHTRGYLFGRAYSIVEPQGELGSTHRANVWPIDSELFDAASDAGWDLDKMPGENLDQLYQVFQKFWDHVVAVQRQNAEGIITVQLPE
jgi:hypothetical protein